MLLDTYDSIENKSSLISLVSKQYSNDELKLKQKEGEEWLKAMRQEEILRK